MLKFMVNLMLKIISRRHKNDINVKLFKYFIYLPLLCWAPSVVIHKITFDIIDMF